MVISYKDRLEGGFQYVRIRKLRAWTTAGLILATSGLIAVSLAESGASARPLFMPMGGFLPSLLVMLLVGLILEIFFRNLSLKYAKKDGQRYLMVTSLMARAKGIMAIGVVIAIVLFAPATRTAMDASATPPGSSGTLAAGESANIIFDNQDAFGVTRYTTLLITMTSAGRLNLQVTRGSTVVGLSQDRIDVMGGSVLLGVDLSTIYTYTVTLLNPTNGGVGYAYQLQGAVFPALFTVVPGIAAAFVVTSILLYLYLSPRRDRYKQAAIYSGEFHIDVGAGERLYSEYVTPRPVGRPAPKGNSPHSAPAPTPIVSPYVAPPVPVRPVATAPPVPPRAVPSAPPAAASPPSPTSLDLFAEGATMFSRGAFEFAIQKFDQVIKLEARHTRAHLGKAEALLRLGDTTEALEAYDEVLRYDRGNLDALLGTAAVYSAERRWRDVIDLADTFLGMQPGNPEMLVYRGDAQLALGKRSEAQISYAAVLLRRPSDPAILARIERSKVDIVGIQSRALIASASGNLGQAIALFDEVLKLEPDNSNALVGKSVALRRSGRVDDALECLDAVLARQPGHGGALLNRGRILEERGDLEDSLGAYNRLIELNPVDPDAWVAQGDVLAKMGRDEAALKSYREALKFSPQDEDTKGKITALDAALEGEGLLLRELVLIKGIGPAKARALRDAGFRTIEDFRNATEEALTQVRGVNRKVASDIVKHFRSRVRRDAQP